MQIVLPREQWQLRYLTRNIYNIFSPIPYGLKGDPVWVIKEIAAWHNPVMVEDMSGKRFHVRHEFLSETPVNAASVAKSPIPVASTPTFRDDLPKPKDKNAQASLF